MSSATCTATRLRTPSCGLEPYISPISRLYLRYISPTSQDATVRRYWPEGGGAQLDPVGPSPLLISLDQVRARG